MSVLKRGLQTIAVLLLCFGLPGAALAQDTRSFTGQAHNVSVGLTDTVELRITETAQGSFSLIGSFGTTDLAGDVAGTGSYPTYDDGILACTAGQECLLFSGTIKLDSRAGFDDGTETSFVLHLHIDPTTGTATGAYHIGPLDGFTFEQYGIVTLSAAIT